jgi:hypothetical protein
MVMTIELEKILKNIDDMFVPRTDALRAPYQSCNMRAGTHIRRHLCEADPHRCPIAACFVAFKLFATTSNGTRPRLSVDFGQSMPESSSFSART